MKEIWKDVSGYEGIYQVSNLGVVKNVITGKIKCQSKNNKGYMRVLLSKEAKHRQHYVHRLVAEAFIDNPNNYLQVNHKDENKNNNMLSNLEWCDCQYNIDYSLSKKVNQYDLGGNFIKQWKSIIEASRSTNIPDTNIINCCRGTQRKSGGYIWKYAHKSEVVYA